MPKTQKQIEIMVMVRRKWTVHDSATSTLMARHTDSIALLGRYAATGAALHDGVL